MRLIAANGCGLDYPLDNSQILLNLRIHGEIYINFALRRAIAAHTHIQINKFLVNNNK